MSASWNIYMNHSKIGVYSNILSLTSVIRSLLLDIPLAFGSGYI